MTGAVMISDKRVSLLWAGPDRASAVADVHAKVFDPAWDIASVRGLLDHPAATSFVATLGAPTDVIGFIIGQLAADEAEILSIGVLPEYQKHGVGKMLVEGLMRAVQRAEAQRMFLDVATDNVAALQLYSKLGFRPSGVRKGYYARPSSSAVDAVTMARSLTI